MMFGIRPHNRRTRGMQRGEDWFPMMNWPQSVAEFFESGPHWSGGFRVDIQEQDSNYVLEAEIPGTSKDNIHVDVENDHLTIRVQQDELTEEKDDRYIRRERRQSACQRSFYIGDIKAEEITAEYKDGILRIQLPKLEDAAQGRRAIDIQ